MTICPKCKGMVGDIYPPGEHHVCHITRLIPEDYKPFKGQKCAQCGSTTIDHTENECRINRQMPVKDKLEERLK